MMISKLDLSEQLDLFKIFGDVLPLLQKAELKKPFSEEANHLQEKSICSLRLSFG